MNLPNKLSLLRIALIPVIMIGLMHGGMRSPDPGTVVWFRVAALVLVIIAVVTDFFDGKIARERKLITDLGKLLDPLADKLLVATAFVCFVQLQIFAAWMVVLILCREFLITGLRSLAASKGVVMAADKWGKHKTAWQMATMIVTLLVLVVREALRATGVWPTIQVGAFGADALAKAFVHVPMLVALFLTVYSGYVYLSKNWDLISKSDS